MLLDYHTPPAPPVTVAPMPLGAGLRPLITGATGELGQRAVEAAVRASMIPTATGRNTSILRRLTHYGIRTVHADLTVEGDDALRWMMLHADAVWHCAALTAPWAPYSAFYESNVLAAERAFTAAAVCEVPLFLWVGDAALAFDFTTGTRAPGDHHRVTKTVAEMRLLALAKQHPATRLEIVRPGAKESAPEYVCEQVLSTFLAETQRVRR